MKFFRPLVLVAVLAACWLVLIAWPSLLKLPFLSSPLKFISKDYFFGDSKAKKPNFGIKDSISALITDSIELKKVVIYEVLDEKAISDRVESLKSAYDLPVTESNITESPYLINVPIKGKYPLDSLFEQFYSSTHSKKVFRIGHYGDSQIEGDRFTSNFRHFFQQYFGGSGYGFIPLDDVTSPVGYTRSQRNWVRHSVFKNTLKNNLYGPGGMTFMYGGDSTGASITLNLDRPCTNIKLAYGYGSPSSRVKVYDHYKKLIAEKALSFSGDYHIETLVSNTPTESIRLECLGKSPYVYGIFADGDSSVQFDNYGIRGQTGDGLLNIDPNRLKSMFDSSNTKMAIIQFGGNVVPYLNSAKKIEYYGEEFRKLLLHFKASLPGGAVLAIGLNDVTGTFNGQTQSFPGISEFRYIQRKHAIENGIAFFDLYQLMGGEESNKIWHESNLTTKDGHFSDKGRAIVSREMCKALYYEYKKFCKRKHRTS